MKQIITLELNDIGKKAFKQDKKIIEVETNGKKITKNFINEIFPIELVDHFYVSQSFLCLEKDANVCVIGYNGNRYLGKVLYQTYNKHLEVEFYLGYNFDESSEDARTFKPIRGQAEFKADGTEVTRCKNKLHLEYISDDEVNTLKSLLINEPFQHIFNMLTDNCDASLTPAGITIGMENIKAPKWLPITEIGSIYNQLRYLKTKYEKCLENSDKCSEDQ